MQPTAWPSRWGRRQARHTDEYNDGDRKAATVHVNPKPAIQSPTDPGVHFSTTWAGDLTSGAQFPALLHRIRHAHCVRVKHTNTLAIRGSFLTGTSLLRPLGNNYGN